MQNNFSTAFATQIMEAKIEHLPIEGDIPKWLNGSFISTGPAQFEVGKSQFNHWFDGFAMLKKFTFSNGNVIFQNRFIRSEQYIQGNLKQKMYRNEFATYAKSNWISRAFNIVQSLVQGSYDDNCNVNIQRIDNRYIAMTESNHQIEFDLFDLQTIGTFKYEDNILGQMELAHPQVDTFTNETINITTEMANENRYHIFKIAPGSIKRELIYTYVSDALFYMHTFCITQNYIILYQSPLKMNKLKLFLNLPFNNTLYWQEKDQSYFIVIDRRDLKVIKIATEPFFCIHSVNAFENNHEIILDLICYGKGNPYNDLFLTNLKADQPNLNASTLKRFIINTQSKQLQIIPLDDQTIEFPRMNDRKHNGQIYQYFYANLLTDPNAQFFNAVQKYDTVSGQRKIWQKAGYFPGEPVFVANGHQQEDEGVLLSIVFNANTACSALVILDSQSMQQRAEIQLPFHLPFGLHGNFF